MLHEQEGYPVSAGCELLGLSRSAYYYQAIEKDESELEATIEEIAGQYPTYGTRRITEELRREPHRIVVNRKRVHRIMAKKALLIRRKTPKYHTTDSQHALRRYPNLVKDLEITHPEHVWVSDITYIRLKNDFVYLAVIMDVFTRAIRGWCLGRTIDQELTLTALRAALETHTPEHHHSDQGLQYAAHTYTTLLKSHGVRISMAAVGRPTENGYAERLIRTIKEEEVDLSEYYDFKDAKEQIGHFIQDVYNTKRIHSSLGYLTPVVFEFAYRLTQIQTTPVSP